MKSCLFLLIFSTFFVLGCTKADSEAYRRDPILQDFISQQGSTNSQLEALNKQIEGIKKDIQSSVPQSGQYGVQRKRLEEHEARADRLKQQLQFWKIKIESRAKEAQMEYLAAFKDKKDWPDPDKTKAYMAEKRLRQAKMSWDQKDRIEEYKKANMPNQKGESAPHGN